MSRVRRGGSGAWTVAVAAVLMVATTVAAVRWPVVSDAAVLASVVVLGWGAVGFLRVRRRSVRGGR